MNLPSAPTWRPAVGAAPDAAPASAGQGWPADLRYGAVGFALAFVALPLYVVLPQHYASRLGIPLAWLGGLLLGARLLDAVLDPALGRCCDQLARRGDDRVLAWGRGAAGLLAVGFTALFLPPALPPAALLAWAAGALLLTYVSYSFLSIAHQAWAARLGGDAAQRSRTVAWREGLGVLGVVVASVAPGLWGLPATAALLALGLGLGCWAWQHAPRPGPGGLPTADPPTAQPAPTRAATGWAGWPPAFTRLLLVYLCNGIASAIPATLVLFFVQDRLQAPAAWEALFLGSYFLSAALSLPLWLRLVRRWGLAHTWLIGMGTAIAAFAWAWPLQAGDWQAFLAVCMLSGLALGADLVCPGALLNGVLQQGPTRPNAPAAPAADGPARATGTPGRLMGWWHCATKLNLALAAGLALPLLDAAGYAPGTRSSDGLLALHAAYCLLPCALKAVAATLLYLLWLRKPG